jgi:SAM-dependent methyltransferase
MAAMAAEGFKVIGVERSEQVVAAVNAHADFLDVRHGDVEDLSLADGSIDAYVSLGVVEHFEDGPQTALAEAARVLKPGGWAFVSVPYLNPRRERILRGLGSPAVREDLSFHQYYFSREEVDDSLSQAGLVVKDHLPYSVEAFLVREHPIFGAFWRSGLCRDRVKRILRPRFCAAGSRSRWSYGHMILAVAERAGEPD